MQVEVKLTGNLGQSLPEGHGRFSLSKVLNEEATVRELLTELKISEKPYILVLVNGRRVEKDHVLKDGDTVSPLRPTGGG
jgi:sulfur carrier protein ThiS